MQNFSLPGIKNVPAQSVSEGAMLIEERLNKYELATLTASNG